MDNLFVEAEPAGGDGPDAMGSVEVSLPQSKGARRNLGIAYLRSLTAHAALRAAYLQMNRLEEAETVARRTLDIGSTSEPARHKNDSQALKYLQEGALPESSSPHRPDPGPLRHEAGRKGATRGLSFVGRKRCAIGSRDLAIVIKVSRLGRGSPGSGAPWQRVPGYTGTWSPHLVYP